MKLVDGGNLAQHLPRLVRDPRAGVRLLATVARAVDFSPQGRILHRDLKPANILLDGGGEPHVADFGLAKRLEDGPTLTQSGLIVGTPNYMAPEQAGKNTGLTTAADKSSSLGAIRSTSLLTGRPPFREVRRPWPRSCRCWIRSRCPRGRGRGGWTATWRRFA